MASIQASRPRGFDEFMQRASRLLSEQSIASGLAFAPQADDVIVSPFAKCGTTWIQQIVHSLRSRGDLDFDDISRVVPWIETALDLGLDLDAPQRFRPRAFKSHLSWDKVPKGARYIVALRDPRDALVSMFRFMEGWHFEPGTIAIDEYAERRFMDLSTGRHFWGHLLSWWTQRDNPSVLLLSYETMRAGPEAAIQRIAAFIDIDLDDELLALTLRQSSLQFMLANRHRYDDLLMRRHSEKVCGLPPDSDSAKVRRGEVGSHREELSDEVVARLDAIWREQVEPVTGHPDYEALRAELGR